jgi:hypothetical protein
VDGRTDRRKKNMTKLTVVFRNFADALTKKILLHFDFYSQLLSFRTNLMVAGGGGTGSGNEQRSEAIERTLS